MKLSPEQMLKKTLAYAKNIDKAMSKSVFVGLPKEKISSKVYKSGATVLEVGAGHEFGVPGKLPRRSFLRTPFIINSKKTEDLISEQFGLVFYGLDAEKALGRLGVFAQGLSQDAFRNRGFGTWKDISEETKKRKGSSGILIDQGTLRQSITWVIR